MVVQQIKLCFLEPLECLFHNSASQIIPNTLNGMIAIIKQTEMFKSRSKKHF